MASNSPVGASAVPGTLIYSKSSRRILLLEASKELVDLIFGFLTLPLGCILRLLTEANAQQQPPLLDMRNASNDLDDKPLLAILNLYASVQRFEASRMCAEKVTLLDPKPAIPWGGKLGFATRSENAGAGGVGGASGFFCCTASPGPCEYIASVPDQKCPKHNKKMVTICKVVGQDNNFILPASPKAQTTKDKFTDGGKKKGGTTETPREALGSPLDIGFVKPETAYMITNSLEIFPSSSISSIFKLAPIKYQRVDDLASLEISVSGEEVLQLLKASLNSSTNVLNDVFVKFSNQFASVAL